MPDLSCGGPPCRQQRAALCIQRNWRRYQARKAFLLYRRRVVRLQCAWRSKLARRDLRKRRASQREAGKLLQVCCPPLDQLWFSVLEYALLPMSVEASLTWALCRFSSSFVLDILLAYSQAPS